MTSLLESEIGSFLDAMMLEKGLSDNTCRGYAADLRFFAGFLAERGVASGAGIRREHIAGFLRAERDSHLRGSTRARRSTAIRMWLRHLKESRQIVDNPAELMDPPRKSRVLPKVLSESEVFALIEAVNGEGVRDVRDRAMLEVMYGCGLRVSEVCALRIDDIVSGGELVRIFGKGSKERVVPIGRAAGRALTAYVDGARAVFAHDVALPGEVFLTRLGRPFTRQGVFKVVRERAAAVGIAPSRISPHVLRHCFASHMLAHGADIRSIQELLGHADIGTTQVYTHVDAARFGELHRRCHPRAEG